MTEHERLLNGIADTMMENGGAMPPLPEGCLALSVNLWPEPPAEPTEVRFSGLWEGDAVLCTRSLDGYSVEGGLHRVKKTRRRPGRRRMRLSAWVASRRSP